MYYFTETIINFTLEEIDLKSSLLQIEYTYAKKLFKHHNCYSVSCCTRNLDTTTAFQATILLIYA